MLAAISLPQKAPEIYNKPGFRLRGLMLYIAPMIGAFGSVLLIIILLADLASKSWIYPSLFCLWILLGVAFYRHRRKSIERQTGRKFEDMIKDELN